MTKFTEIKTTIRIAWFGQDGPDYSGLVKIGGDSAVPVIGSAIANLEIDVEVGGKATTHLANLSLESWQEKQLRDILRWAIEEHGGELLSGMEERLEKPSRMESTL